LPVALGKQAVQSLYRLQHIRAIPLRDEVPSERIDIGRVCATPGFEAPRQVHLRRHVAGLRRIPDPARTVEGPVHAHFTGQAGFAEFVLRQRKPAKHRLRKPIKIALSALRHTSPLSPAQSKFVLLLRRAVRYFLEPLQLFSEEAGYLASPKIVFGRVEVVSRPALGEGEGRLAE